MKKYCTIIGNVIYCCIVISMMVVSMAIIATHNHATDSSSNQNSFTSMRDDLTTGVYQKFSAKVIANQRQVHLRLVDGRYICGQCPIIPPNVPALPRPDESQLIPTPSYRAKDSTASATDSHTTNQEAVDQKQESSDPSQIGSQLPRNIKDPTSENVLSDHDNAQPREPNPPTSPAPTTRPEASWSALNFDNWGIAYDNTTGTYYYANSGNVYKITDQSFHADIVGTHPDWLDGVKMTFVGNLP